VRLNPLLVVFLMLIVAPLRGNAQTGSAPPPGVPRDRAEWIAFKDADFPVPTGVPPVAVLTAMEELLGSRDPVLRDDVGYGLTVAWIYRDRRVSDDEIRAFAERLRRNLAPGPAGDAVLARSFSALALSVVAAADVKAPVLDDPGRHALIEAATAFLRNEPDTRGYDPAVGWVHATAHAADLLKFLARSPRLTAGEQLAIAGALLTRIDRPGPVFAWGEDERLAAAFRSLVLRPDFDAVPLDAWLAGLEPAWTALWKGAPLDTSAYARLANARHVLRCLYVSLASTKDAPQAARDVAARLLATLAAMD